MLRKTAWGVMVALAGLIAAYALSLAFLPGLRTPFVDALFEGKALRTLGHLAGGGIALGAGALQFSTRLRVEKPRIHRWIGRAYLGTVLIGGVSALFLAPASSGGMPAHWGFGLLAVLWLVTSLLALVRVRSRDFAAHREWMIRSYALCLAAVMLRIYMPLSAVAGIPFEDAYPAVAWLCWVPNLIVAEWFFVRSSFAPLKPRLGAVLVFTLMASSSPLLAQTAPDPGLPGVFSALEGSWEGTGTLLERPGVFEMSWESGPEGFVRLSFSNGWVASEGDGTPVLSARATYLVVTDSSALGVWIDDRPQRLTLDAVLTDSTIVTRWAAPAENGRTEYVVRSPASIVVRDYVIVDGADRLFSEAVYKRRTTQRPG